MTGLIESSTQDDDVGDYVVTVPATDCKPTRFVRMSDSTCYVFLDENDIK